MQWVTFRRHFPATGALQCPENERSKNRGFKWIFQETGRFQRIFNNNFNNTLGSHKPTVKFPEQETFTIMEILANL